MDVPPLAAPRRTRRASPARLTLGGRAMMRNALRRFCKTSAQALNRQPIPERHRLLTLAGHPWPAELETLHLLIPGTTGAGKSTLIEELLDGVRARGERAIVCDPN